MNRFSNGVPAPTARLVTEEAAAAMVLLVAKAVDDAPLEQWLMENQAAIAVRISEGSAAYAA